MPAFIHEIGRDKPALKEDLLDLSRAYRHKKKSDNFLVESDLFDGRVGWFHVSWCEERVYAFFQNGAFVAPEIWFMEKQNIARENRRKFPWQSIRVIVKRRQALLRSFWRRSDCDFDPRPAA